MNTAIGCFEGVEYFWCSPREGTCIAMVPLGSVPAEFEANDIVSFLGVAELLGLDKNALVRRSGFGERGDFYIEIWEDIGTP